MADERDAPCIAVDMSESMLSPHAPAAAAAAAAPAVGRVVSVVVRGGELIMADRESEELALPAKVGLGAFQAPLPPAVGPQAALKCPYRRHRVTRDRPVALRAQGPHR